MDQLTPAADPLPPRLAWFAPWRWKRRWHVLVALLLVAYPLSVGPAFGLYARGWFPSQIYAVVYQPLYWCAAQNAQFRDLFDWYADLFAPYDYYMPYF